MSTAIRVELPPELLAQARAFVEEGWATELNELLAEALRRYLESHSSQISETFIREDVEWGLKGNEHPQFGSAKGLIKMTEDFDEPFKDFDEYVK